MTPTIMTELSEGLQVFLKKMFDIVGAPHDLPLIDDWYTKYEWTEAQEAEFKEFFFNFAKTHPKRRDVFTVSRMRKKDIETTYSWWSLMYSWKTQETS